MSSTAPMQQAKADTFASSAQHTSQLTTQSQQISAGDAGEFADLRPQTTTQRQRQDAANHSLQSRQLKTFQHITQHSGRAAQLKSLGAMMDAPAVQCMGEEEDATQVKSASENTAQFETAAEVPKPNNTGLPDNLKSGIESLSGMSMDHVKVHYNSSQPAQLNAHAYAQGSEIHVAPGQEQHLPHEAWHVVQQAQGRVQPTMQMKAGVAVNDDVGLEAEADVMGAKALAQLSHETTISTPTEFANTIKQTKNTSSIQRKIAVTGSLIPDATYEEDTSEFHTTEVAPTGNVADYAAAPDVPATNPNKDYAGTNNLGFLLNVSSMNKSGAPTDINQGDIEARHTVARYNQGFANANEAKNRLRMVINVNQYNDPKTSDDIPNLLATAVQTQRAADEISNSHGRVAVVGHLWTNKWTRSDTGVAVTTEAVRTEYRNQLAATGEAALKAGYNRPQFAFGTMREVTFKHPQTANFKTHFDNRHLNTFVHLGDGDIIDVTTGGNNTGVYDRMDTWRNASPENRNKRLIGGGVEYRARDVGGDAPDAQGDFLSLLSNLDMNNRDSMASVDGKAPWMTEPNTFIDYAALHGIVGEWKNLPGFMVDVGSVLGGLVGDGEATFNALDLSIISSANTHNVVAADLDAPTLAEFIHGIKTYKDSSFRPGPWTGGVIKTLDMVGAGRTKKQALKLCVYIMREKVGAIDNANAPPELKAIFTDFKAGEWTAAWARPARVALWGAPNVGKVEDFADKLVWQISNAWTEYQNL